MTRRPDYFLHVADDWTEIAFVEEPDRHLTPTLSIWRIDDADGQWEETLTRARKPPGEGWHWVNNEGHVFARWRRPARRRQDLKWVRKRSGPGGQVRGCTTVKGKKQSRAKEPGHAW
jgi:hypothetical protein